MTTSTTNQTGMEALTRRGRGASGCPGDHPAERGSHPRDERPLSATLKRGHDDRLRDFDLRATRPCCPERKEMGATTRGEPRPWWADQFEVGAQLRRVAEAGAVAVIADAGK